MEEKSNSIDSPKGNSGFSFTHILMLICLVLVFLALLSHNKRDLAVLEGGMPGPVRNWIGPAGALFSRAAFYLFGVAVYPIFAFLAICLLRPLIKIPVSRKGYLGSVAAVIIGITILFGMYPEKFCFITDYLGIGSSSVPSSALSGGVVGQRLAAPLASRAPGLITGTIGEIGAFVVALFFLLSGLFFVWLCDWQPLLNVRLRNRESKSEKEIELDKLREKEKQAVTREESISELKKKRQEEVESGVEAPNKLKTTVQEAKETEQKAFEDEIVIEKEKNAGTVELGKEETQKKPTETSQRQPQPTIKKVKNYGNVEYVLPPVSLLDKGKEVVGESIDIIEASKRILQSTLDSFKIDGQVVDHVSGPRVTRFEISLAPGIKVDRVTSIINNISMDLQAESIRIQAPIPGKNTIGVEVPNSTIATIPLRSIMESDTWKASKAEIPVILGKDVSGRISILDLAKAPHLLIAGATGSGKSVCIHTIILSMLYRFSPFDLKMILVDPKMVEFNYYANIPHLITPVVTNPKKVPVALHWAVNEMEKRYKILSITKARNLHTFNSRTPSSEEIFDDEGKPIPAKIPYLVIIIDELADIMMTEAKQDVENCIARIAQKGRAAGIHIIVATQTPRVNIITGIIKANMPTRIALQVSSIVDSKVIIDGKGAEKLLGKGDMLIIPPGSSNLERLQGTWVSDREIEKVACFISDQLEPDFNDEVMVSETEGLEEELAATEESFQTGSGTAKFAKYIKPDDDPLVKRAIEIILTENKASTSYLQRRMGIGYNKAANIIEELEHRGIVGPPIGASAKRDILVETDGVSSGFSDDEDA